MAKTRNMARYLTRVPVDIKFWLEREADRYGSSVNSEIVRAIRERMDRAGCPQKGGEPAVGQEA